MRSAGRPARFALLSGILILAAGIGSATPTWAGCRLNARQLIQLAALGEIRFVAPSTSMVPTLPLRSQFAARPLPAGEVVTRGDVVALCTAQDPGTIYVKRVVAVGGDRVRLKRNHLIVDGAPVERERLPDHTYNDDSRDRTLACWRERLDGRAWRACVEPDGSPLSDTREVEVPEGHLFLLGDNRDNSVDSRLESFGFVPLDNVVGRVEEKYVGAERVLVDAE